MKSFCPICEYNDCSELIVDLLVCNACNHIFKSAPNTETVFKTSQLHLYPLPVDELRVLVEQVGENAQLHYKFPSMCFYGLEIEPAMFYREGYNHYFNQMSLMILLKRCGLTPIYQNNTWNGNICETTIIVKKEDGKIWGIQ